MTGAGPGNGVDRPDYALQVLTKHTLREVELPSGVRVRVRIPGPDTLLRHRSLPPRLREIALTFAKGVDPAKLSESELLEFLDYRRELVAWSLREVWDEDGSQWRELRVTGAELAAAGMDEEDLGALAEIATRERTPNAITAISRHDRGLISDLEAKGILRAEAAGTDDYAGFRGQRGGAAPGAAGEDVGDPSELDAGDRGPGDRADAGRRPLHPAPDR